MRAIRRLVDDSSAWLATVAANTGEVSAGMHLAHARWGRGMFKELGIAALLVMLAASTAVLARPPNHGAASAAPAPAGPVNEALLVEHRQYLRHESPTPGEPVGAW